MADRSKPTAETVVGLELRTRYKGGLSDVEKTLALPAAEIGHYLARTIRRRVTQENLWLHGKARPYQKLRGPANADSRIVIKHTPYTPGTEGFDYEVIKSGPFAGYAVYKDRNAYDIAVKKSRRTGPITFVRTGELWWKRLRVYVGGPNRVKVYFFGTHSGGPKDKRAPNKKLRASRLAMVHVKNHPGSMLSVTDAEMVHVARIVRRRTAEQINAAVQGQNITSRIQAANRTAAGIERRFSKMLGD